MSFLMAFLTKILWAQVVPFDAIYKWISAILKNLILHTTLLHFQLYDLIFSFVQNARVFFVASSTLLLTNASLVR